MPRYTLGSARNAAHNAKHNAAHNVQPRTVPALYIAIEYGILRELLYIAMENLILFTVSCYGTKYEIWIEEFRSSGHKNLS